MAANLTYLLAEASNIVKTEAYIGYCQPTGDKTKALSDVTKLAYPFAVCHFGISFFTALYFIRIIFYRSSQRPEN